MKVNINRSVKVELTYEGKKVLNEYLKDNGIDTFDEDVLECQLWELFQIFGNHLQLGCETLFKNNEIEL